MAKIKCSNIFCRSTDISLIKEKKKLSINLNPLHPFTLLQEKTMGKQTYHCNKCGKVFKA